MQKGYRITPAEYDYPRKGFFAEYRWLWIWWPLHIGARETKRECEDLIKIHSKDLLK